MRDPALDSLLAQAARRGDVAEMETLVSQGADPRAVGVLFAAAQEGQVLSVDWLIERGADPSARDGEGRNVLEAAMLRNRAALVKALLDRGLFAEPDERGFLPIHMAALCGNQSIVETVLDCGGDIEGPAGKAEANGLQKWFLRRFFDVLSAPTELEDARPLHIAVLASNLSAVKVLLKFGASVHSLDAHGRTPLHYDVGDSFEPHRLIFACGGSMREMDSSGKPPTYFLEHQDEVWVRGLLRQEHASLIRAREKVLSGGPRPKFKPKSASKKLSAELLTRMEQAAISGDIGGLRSAIGQGVAVDQRLRRGKTRAIHLAAEYGHSLAIEYLIQAGADPLALDGGGKSPIHRAAASGRAEAVRVLLDHGTPPEHMDRSERTPLVAAAERDGNAETIRVLIEGGAAVDQAMTKNYYAGQTALFFAVARLRDDVVEALLECGANANHRDHQDRTPLLWMAELAAYQVEMGPTSPSRRVAELLLEAGCDPNLKNRRGYTIHDADYSFLNREFATFLSQTVRQFESRQRKAKKS
ncbi:MAG: ankyrin repeat domain-containing protein [Sumerlaeia bacterium]